MDHLQGSTSLFYLLASPCYMTEYASWCFDRDSSQLLQYIMPMLVSRHASVWYQNVPHAHALVAVRQTPSCIKLL